MAEQVTVSKPAPFVEKLGTQLADNVLAQQGVPIVSQGLAGLQKSITDAGLPTAKQAFETDDQFAKRQELANAQQRAALAFDQRQLGLQGLKPTVAGQDVLQGTAQDIAKAAAGVGTAQEGLGSFQPFLEQAQTAATDAGTALGGINLGPITAQQLATIDRDKDSSTFGQTITPTLAEGSYMSPYQSQVIDATLAAFDRNIQKQELQIKDQAAKLGVLGTGRAGVRLGEFDTGAATQRALLEAQLLQQGFGQAQAARQQDIANRGALASQQQSLGAFQSGLGAQAQGILGTNVSRLGQLGALNQAQTQAESDAAREFARITAFQPQEQLDRFGAQVTGIMGGYPGQTTQTVVPNPTPLQTALGVGTTLAGIYGATRPGANVNFGFGTT
jgi:hypothetical protein